MKLNESRSVSYNDNSLILQHKNSDMPKIQIVEKIVFMSKIKDKNHVESQTENLNPEVVDNETQTD